MPLWFIGRLAHPFVRPVEVQFVDQPRIPGPGESCVAHCGDGLGARNLSMICRHGSYGDS